MSVININGNDFELDLLDADAMEKYQTALNMTTEKIEKIQADVKNQGDGLHVAESMRAQCAIVRDFVNAIFGEGASEKCFPRENHLGDHMTAFTKICNQANVAVRQTQDIISKYSGERLNRQQRRAQMKVAANRSQ